MLRPTQLSRGQAVQRRLSRCLVLCVLLLPNFVEAQVSTAFTLSDALRAMRESHPLLRVQLREVRAREADQVDAKLWSNPSLGGNWAKGVRNTTYDQLGYVSFGVSQFVELANVPGVRKRQAGFLVAAADAELRGVELDLSLNVESALIDLAAALRTQQLLEQTLAQIREAARIVEDRVRLGAAPRYDAARIAVTLAMAEADEREGMAAIARAWADFRAAVGPGAATLQGEPDYALSAGPALPNVAQLIAMMQRSQPELEAARARAKASSEGLLVSRRSVFSGVLVSLGGGFGAGPDQLDVGAGFSLPLPLVDRGQGAIPAARERAQQAESYVEAVRVPAALRLPGMRREVELRREALEQYSAHSIPRGEEMLQQAQAGYQAGRFSVLELVDAYRAFRDAHLRQIALSVSLRQAEVELGRVLGRSLRDL